MMAATPCTSRKAGATYYHTAGRRVTRREVDGGFYDDFECTDCGDAWEIWYGENDI